MVSSIKIFLSPTFPPIIYATNSADSVVNLPNFCSYLLVKAIDVRITRVEFGIRLAMYSLYIFVMLLHFGSIRAAHELVSDIIFLDDLIWKK